MQVDLQRRPEQQKKLVGKCQLEYAEKKKKTEKCRIDAYNATFPSCFTISQVLTLSPMKEKNIYKQHIDRRALNIWFVFFSFLIRNSYSTQPELFSFEDMRRRTMVLSRDPSSGVVRQGSKEKFIGKYYWVLRYRKRGVNENWKQK